MAKYTCPMHADVKSEHPGSCPECGMALDIKRDASGTDGNYTCPMHPEVVHSEPGKCPHCGMKLELGQ